MDPLTTEVAGNVVVAEKVNDNSNRTTVQSLPNFVGKHRITAAIALLNQQIEFLQEEIKQLEKLGGASIVCKETTEVAWKRWFQPARSSKNRKWI